MSLNRSFNYLIQILFKEKTDKMLLQLLRYTFVGGFAFCIDFLTLFALTEYLNVYYLVSAGIAFINGLTVNYFLSVKWVFNERSMGNKYTEFFLFAFIGIVGLALNEFILWIFTDFLKIYYLISKIITAVIVYLWNFFVRKFLLFNRSKI
jgi:putative flippase GtrA